MNRLILIGNGFDLAHGLKTDYNSFILWYLKDCFIKAFDDYGFEDDLIKISRRKTDFFATATTHKTISEFIDVFYEKGFDELLYSKEFKVSGRQDIWLNPFETHVKSSFVERLIINCKNANWVDIENEFYSWLIIILNGSKKHEKKELLDALNQTLKFVIVKLEEYLKSLETPSIINSYKNIFESKFKFDEIIDSLNILSLTPNTTLLLNFNYTSTVENYFGPNGITNRIEVNYIHGKIKDENNPLIFGFGDEIDDDYKKIEDEKINAYFKYIKSFWYFKTSNYHSLIRFLESRNFQVFILGHSCGLSDRTMLSMIFEHDNCKSIKIFYHEFDGGNNHEDLTQEISRHFKNKVDMRRKIVPFDKSSPMPQIN
jgi:hypothetical protein